MNAHCPQIKICGFTDPGEAEACAQAGADAVGLVFYPPSPRHVNVDQAARITARLPDRVTPVGVFVNPSLEELQRAVGQCGLKAVQLHGAESPDFVRGFHLREDVPVIKVLFTERAPGLEAAPQYDAAAFLVECGRGKLPGGNARQWNWALAKPFGRQYPLILAGGLDPQTVATAIADGLPDAVDASSGLEMAPGRKDLKKIEVFIKTVRQTSALYQANGKRIRTVF